MLELAAATRSLAFVSELAVRRDDPNVRVLPVSGLSLRRELALIRHPARPASAAAVAFARTLGEIRKRAAAR